MGFHLTLQSGAFFFLNTLVAQVAVLPFGKFLAYALPTRRFRTFGYEWTLNPGPFNMKEHTVIISMVNVTWNTPYVGAAFIVQRSIYGQHLSAGYRMLVSLSTQLMGVAMAGLYRQIAVWPAYMIWPGTLVSCSLMQTLHRSWGKYEKNHMNRYKFFMICMLASGLFYWLPGYFFTGLSYFSWICWIVPSSPVVNVLFGSTTGLGFSLLTFDWSQIISVSQGSPLVSPVRVPMTAPYVYDDSDSIYSGGLRSTSTSVSCCSSGSSLLPSTVSKFARTFLLLRSDIYSGSHEHGLLQVLARFGWYSFRQHGPSLRRLSDPHRRSLRSGEVRGVFSPIPRINQCALLRLSLRSHSRCCGPRLP